MAYAKPRESNFVPTHLDDPMTARIDEVTTELCGWDGGEYYNWATAVVDRLAEDRTKLAMVWLEEELQNRKTEKNLSFWNFKIQSNKFANVLSKLNSKKGDRLFLMLPNIPELWEIELGCMKSGVVYMPASTLLSSKDIAYRLNASQAKIVVTDEENAPKVEAVKKECPSVTHFILVEREEGYPHQTETEVKGLRDWRKYNELMSPASPKFIPNERTKSDEDHVIYFTSGTVGYPKMVVHTNVSYPVGHSITGKFWLNLKDTDLHWNISSPGWAKHAWSTVYGPWNCGAAIFVYNHKARFNAARHLEILQEYEITTFCAPPTAWRMLVLEELEKYDLSSLRECVSAGEPLNPEVIHAWRKFTGITIREGYGQTETVCVIANQPGLPQKDGSMGKPMPGFYVSVIDEDGKELPAGKEGDIAIRVKPERPIALMKGYLDRVDLNEEVMRNAEWYVTGDRGIKDEEGHFFFVGRSDDVIKSSGYRIGPFEVESAVLEHSGVAESAAVGVPDPIRGQLVKVFVVLKPNWEPSEKLAEDIAQTVARVTAPYKKPRRIEFVNELPKTISGKIRRTELRQQELHKYRKTKEVPSSPSSSTKGIEHSVS